MAKAAGNFQDRATVKGGGTMSLGQVMASDLGHIVEAEAFHWGDNAKAGYFDPAETDGDRQWDMVCRFLAPHPINYTNTLELACGHGRNSGKLAALATQMTLVDVNPENIAFCRKRFADKPWDFVVNNGYDLTAVNEWSVTFLHCFEAAVHFDLEIILAYIKEFRRVLAPGGFAFVHHSNVDQHPGIDFRLHPHWRNFMSKQIFAHLAIHNGLELIDQFVFDQGGPEADCFSLVRQPLSDDGAKAPKFPSRGDAPEDEIVRRTEELRVARQEIECLRNDVATLTQNLAAIRASHSWRLTAPLRRIIDAVRRRYPVKP
jgi:ubiquinone/menaquinone biosynthesis C-methylase UbiE